MLFFLLNKVSRGLTGKYSSPPKVIRIPLLGGRGKTFEPTDKPDYSTMLDRAFNNSARSFLEYFLPISRTSIGSQDWFLIIIVLVEL